MRIALFFLAFTLGASVALGLDAADATRRNEERKSVTVVVPVAPGGQAIEVEPVRWNGGG